MGPGRAVPSGGAAGATAARGFPDSGPRAFAARATTLQGTTSNGMCLLPFKTGAFLAGLPVQPVVIKYGKVGSLYM